MKEIGDNWRNRVIRAQHRLEDYAKETLPIVLIGKSIARQAIVENSIEGKKVKLIVNKNTFNEISHHHQNDQRYFERIENTKNIVKLMKIAAYVRDEDPVHGGKNILTFHVFETSINKELWEIKCRKTTDGIYVYYMMPK